LDNLLPSAIYSAEQSRQLDRIASEQFAIPGITLMKRAGRAAWQTLLTAWPAPEHVTVYCGGGNNGGDGYILAGLAAQQQVPTTLIFLSDPNKLQGDAALARDFAAQNGVAFLPFSQDKKPTGIIVDALIGTGARGAPRAIYAAVIDCINSSALPVLAIDIPSGLNADTGAVIGTAVQADITITFICLKQGLLTGRGPALCGNLQFADLGVPKAVHQQVKNPCHLIQYRPLPPRAVDAHKGDSGHVLVIGGDNGFGGAVAMAAEAAARCGAGLVSVATQAEHVNAILTRRPEIMVKSIAKADDLDALLSRATVLVVGPGLGQSAWSLMLLRKVLQSNLPKVVDADALSLLACGESSEDTLRKHRDRHWILTPHPGEAARFLCGDVGQVQHDRYLAVTEIQKARDGVVVLKGAGTLVASEHAIGVCRAGNAGMASGGMGDVLSGVIGALLAQGLGLQEAAELGVQIHGMAGDKAARRGQRGLLATDLMPHLRSLINGHAYG